MRDFKDHKAADILLTLYLLFVCLSSVYLYVTRNKLKLAVILVVLTVVLYVCSHLLLGLVRRIRVINRDISVRHAFIAFLIYFAVCMIILLIWYIAGAPGSFQDDNIAQYSQAITGEYDSWHPIWHTLVFFKLPLSMVCKPSAVIIFQMLFFAVVFAYLCSTIYSHHGTLASVIVFAFVMINPYTGFILMFPFKDNGFAVCCALAVVLIYDAVLSGRDGSYKAVRVALVGFVLANATLFRYNGILFTAMLLLVLLFYTGWKKWLIAVITFVITIAIIQGPVIKSLDAKVSETELIQIVGMPMSIIGNVIKESPELVDEDIRDFAYNIAPREVWEERYMRGNFNLMKYGGIYNPDTIEKSDFFSIWGMALRCAVVSPQAALESFFSLTDFVYGIDIQDKADIDVCKRQIIDNKYGIKPCGNERVARLLDKYYSVIKMRGYDLIKKLGFTIFMIIVVLLARFRIRSWKDLCRISIVFPILIYDLGTMMLLSGHDSRFFFVNYPVCPLITVMLLGISSSKNP